MARETILAEGTFSGFFDMGGIYGGQISAITLEVGQAYTVVWDGETFENCVAAPASLNGQDGIGIGNFALAMLGENTGEPFLIGVVSDGSEAAVYTSESDESHTIAIYKETVDGGIVLKDRDGNPVTHHPTGGVRLLMSDGSQRLFVNSDDVPTPMEKTVGAEDVDFTNGYMEVTPDSGNVLSKVTVEKPANLLAENIKEGIDIAGIVGELAGGGGSAKVAWGILPKPASNTTNQHFTHNLGVVPDFILVETISVPAYGNTTSTIYPHNMIGFSKALGGVLGTTRYQRSLVKSSSSGNYVARGYKSSDSPITYAALNTVGIICMANETSFSTVGLNAESAYFWIAIGGLT